MSTKVTVTETAGPKVTVNEAGEVLVTIATGSVTVQGGLGDVVGPSSATDNAIARFDTTTGKKIQNSGITIADGASGTLAGTNTGDQNIFQTIAVSGQSNVVADTTSDTLTLVAGSNISITTDAAADSVTISSNGISGVDWGDIGGTLSDQTDLNSALSGKQPLDSTLTALSGAGAANTFPYFTATDTIANGSVGAGGLSVIAAANSAAIRTLLSTTGVTPSSGTNGFVMQTSPTITTPTITGAVTWQDDIRQEFNPGSVRPGLNVGSHGGNPSSLTNGDLWYNSASNELNARINGATVALGAGGGGGGIGGTVGTTDNAIPRADGTGGSTLQGSLASIDDLGNIEAEGFIGDGSLITGITAAQVGALANGDTGASLTFAEFGLAIFDSAADHFVNFRLNEDLTADKTLTLYVNDADRQIDLGGDLTVAATATISGTNTGDITLTGAPNYIFLSGQTLTRSLINLGSHVTGTLPVANGGTSSTTLTANAVLLGNGTSALQTVAPSTSGNVLTSNGTTWTSAAPANPLNAAMARYQVHPTQWDIYWDANTTAVVSGSGSTGVAGRQLTLQTGATLSSRSQRSGDGGGTNDVFLGASGADQRLIDFSRQVTVGFAFSLIASAGATSDVYIRIGTSSSNTGTLAARGVGIRISNLTLTGLVHDGTTLNTSTALKTVTVGSIMTLVVIQSDGAGNVAFYIDGSLAATLTGGPTSGAITASFTAEALNGATAANTRIHLNQPRIRVD